MNSSANANSDSLELVIEETPVQTPIAANPIMEFPTMRSKYADTASEDDEEWNAEGMAPYDHREELSRYVAPPLELLNDYTDHKFEVDRSELEANKNQIVATLLHYKIEIQKLKQLSGQQSHCMRLYQHQVLEFPE